MGLRDWHRRVLGPAAAHGHLQAGLIALMGGIVLGASGVGLFLAGESLGGSRLAWREAAIALTAVAAPLLFGGVSLALPARPVLRGLMAFGALVNLVAVGLFVLHYPERFNADVLGSDRAPFDAALYAVGSAIVAASLLAQIVGVYVRGHGQADDEDGWWAEGYEVPDWVIERDIDDALKRHPVEWGAAPKATPAIEVGIPGFGDGAVVRGSGVAKRTTLELPALEQNTKRLRGLTAATVDVPAQGMLDATSALGDLRRLQAAHPKRYRPPRASWWRRWLKL